jgi:GntR family transcriptional regulator
MDLPQIDRQSAIPIYYQLKEAIYEKIKTGEWKIGQQVPSLRQLSSELKISLMTARQAIKALVDEKVLAMQRGQGTFILGAGLRQDASIISSFTAEMLRQGFKPSSKVLKKETMTAPNDISAALNLQQGSPIHLISRLRYADNFPVALQEAYLPADLLPDLLKKNMHGSLVSILENEYRIRFHHGTQTIKAGLVDWHKYQLLELPPKAPVLSIERTSFSEDQKPIEFLRSTHRADKYTLSVNLRSDRR